MSPTKYIINNNNNHDDDELMMMIMMRRNSQLAAVALLGGQRTCERQVAGSSAGWASLIVALGKLLTPVCFRHRGV